jgi:rare lipoprotein A
LTVNRCSRTLVPALLVALLVSACSGTPRPGGGAYYGGDRPPSSLPADLAAIPDAVPRHEPRSRTGNNPYTALGKRYTPMKSGKGYVERGMASWYGTKFQGRRTSSGEAYDMFAMTAAHPTLPLPSYVRVTNLDNRRSVVVKVNDRGPFLHGRIIDLSYVAAHKLDIASKGTGRVEVKFIDPDKYAAAATDTTYAGVAGAAGTAIPVTSQDPRQQAILIQVGAYSQFENARNISQLLDLAGYDVVPLARNSNPDDSVYRVRVGPFADHDAAEANRQKLENMLGHPVAVVMH